MPMRVLVTGSSGFIGHAVVRQLLKGGHQVRCLVRKTSSRARIPVDDVEVAVGDILEPDTLRAATAGCDGLIHLASISDWKEINSPRIREIAVQGSRNVLDACIARGPGTIRSVFISSISAINGTDQPEILDENSEYTIKENIPFLTTKREMEDMCRAAAAEGHSVIIACPPETYGPNDTELITSRNLINMLKTNPVLVSRGGVSIAHLDDVADGIIGVLEKGKPGERYALGGDNMSVRQLAEMVLDILGQKRRLIEFPTWFLRGLTKAAVTLHLPLPYTPELIPFATRYFFFDTKKARTELGVTFRPAREVLEPTLAWLKAEGHLKGIVA